MAKTEYHFCSSLSNGSILWFPIFRSQNHNYLIIILFSTTWSIRELKSIFRLWNWRHRGSDLVDIISDTLPLRDISSPVIPPFPAIILGISELNINLSLIINTVNKTPFNTQISMKPNYERKPGFYEACLVNKLYWPHVAIIKLLLSKISKINPISLISLSESLWYISL